MNEDKCHQIHVGSDKGICPKLNVHNSIMPKVSADKYLGSIVSDESQNKKDIESRISKGMGYITQIMIILEEVCFGQFYFDTAVLLRESIFINGMLSSIEANYGLINDDIEKLEILDRILLRKILSAHSKSPSESLYLELGLIPVKFIIIARRLNFLHYLLNLKDDELLHKFFKAQLEFPNKNDWIVTAQENLKHIGMSIDGIKHKSKGKFKKELKKKIRIAALKYLLDISERHEKMDNLKYKQLKLSLIHI